MSENVDLDSERMSQPVKLCASFPICDFRGILLNQESYYVYEN